MKTDIIQLKSSNAIMMLFFILATFGKIVSGCAQTINAKAYDSTYYYLKHKSKVYYGAELSAATSRFTINSNIPEINHMTASFFGGNAGAMVANQIGKLKATIGSYTTDSSVPYNMDLLQGSVSGSIYFLRLKHARSHTLEPYVTIGMSRQQAKFYGNYLPDNSIKNYSVTEVPSLGQVSWTTATLAIGAEYQLESDDLKFIHFFAEAGYGMPFQFNSSNRAFSGTKSTASSWFSVGINVGITK